MLLAILGQIFHTLRANKLRSFLTMFGIGWGVLSIILMTASGEGFKRAQHEGLRQLGKDIMIIWGGRTSLQAEGFQAGRDIRLEYADYVAIRDRARLIKSVSPELIRSGLVAKTDLNYGNFDVRGVIPEYQTLRTIEAGRGRLMNRADNEQARLVCVIGDEVNKQLFNGANSVGRTISLQGQPFTVIGIMPHKELNSNYSGQDHSDIFIPYWTLRRLFSNPGLGTSPERINNLIAAPIRHELFEEAEREVRQILAERWQFDPGDEDAVAIWNTAKQVEMMDIMMGSMQWFLGAVGLVTLGLGALGVVNIMLVSVRERTMEIGIRKSIGARRIAGRHLPGLDRRRHESHRGPALRSELRNPMTIEILRRAFSSLARNHTRTFLTLMGITWGVACFVILFAYGDGFQNAINLGLAHYGKSVTVIWNGQTSLQVGGQRAGRAVHMEMSDYEEIRANCPLVSRVSPEIFR
ncbi:MAG: ABC transporter permease [Acidobacteriota bacterium]